MQNNIVIKQILSEILTFTMVSDIEMIGVYVEEKNKRNVVKTIDKSKSVIIEATSADDKNVLNISNGFGMYDLQLIKGMCDHYLFNYPDTKTEIIEEKIVNQSDGSENIVPVEISFRNSNISASYRLMDIKLMPVIPKFKGAEWDLVFNPKMEKIIELNNLSSLFTREGFSSFVFQEDKNKLKVIIGDMNSTNHRASMVFHNELNTTLSMNENEKNMKFTPNKWPIQQFLNIMKLFNDKNQAEISVSYKGIMKIEIKTNVFLWRYYIPALKG